jgi:rhamnosyltransferase subunit B
VSLRLGAEGALRGEPGGGAASGPAVRILITTIGSAGDVNPFVAIGRALRQRGHDVVMLVNPHFEPRVRAAGLGFEPLGTEEDFLRALHHPDLVHPRKSPALVVRELIHTAVRPTVEAVERLVREFKPDVLLRHHISFGARWVAERHGVPQAVVVLSPMFWFSRHEAPIYRPLPLMRRQPYWVVRAGVRVGRHMMRWIVDRPMNALAREMGYPTTRDMIFHEAVRPGEDGAVLGLWSPHVRPRMPDDPPSSTICGYAWFDRQHVDEHAPEDIGRFLEDGEPPIIFTLGTSVVHHAGDFYRRAAEACRLLGRRGLLLTGRPEYAPPARDLPRGVAAFTYAPFSAVLHRGCVTVHHGGAGTTAQAMRAGRPALIIPFANDEFDNAEHARDLGVAESLWNPRASPRTLARLLGRLLDDDGVRTRAADLGARLRAEDGAATAADTLERIAAGAARPVTAQEVRSA